MIWRHPGSIIVVGLSFFALGGFSWRSYQQFMFLQAQNMSSLSVFDEIIIPLVGLCLLCQLIIIVFTSVQLIPNLKQLSQAFLINQASISRVKVLSSLIKPVFGLALLPLLYFMLIAVVFDRYTELDWGRLIPTICGLLLITGVYSFIVMSVCLLCRRMLMAVVLASASLILLMLFEFGLQSLIPQEYWRSILTIFLVLREGSINMADVLRLSALVIMASTACYLVLVRQQLVAKKFAVSLLLLGVVVTSLAWLVPGHFDTSKSKRNTLASSIQSQLTSHTEPLKIVAVINDETAKDEITRGFNIIKNFYSNSQLSFKSRQQLPPQLQHAGEYIQLSLGELQQAVAYPFQETTKMAIETALAQMLGRKSQWITFVEGHGEASPFGQTSSDLTQFYQMLKQAGWPVAAQNLNLTPFISDNTTVLVIAASKQKWLTKEVNLVNDYLERGGNLLVLLDPTSHFPELLQKKFGVSRFQGTLIDWNGYQSGTPHPAIVVVKDLGQHPLVSHLNSLLAFPWSAGLSHKSDDSDYVVEPVITTHPGVWNELNIERDTLQLDELEGELQQAFNLVLAFQSRQIKQRIIFVGDSHFISDSAINNYANQQFSHNIISWLTHIDFAEVASERNADSHMVASPWGNFLLTWGFGLVMPMMIFFVWYWQRRLKQARHENKA